ncbi:MAG: carboxypeptidase-like regulatory domain-containing protein [Bacteroidetes bacterium]|nr:carboxypeptidase-like regulatory domain-containing protein [Bacteroidota bacterium]
MKRLLILLMLAVCASPKAFAQGVGTLAGRVVDEFDRMGLPGANVIVEGTSLGAATNLDGEYEIYDVPVGLYNVMAQSSATMT